MTTPGVAVRLKDLQPDAAAELNNITELAPQVTDAQLLALCTAYIEAALRSRIWQAPEEDLTEKEQAFIAFTEQFVTSVGNMRREQVERLLEFATADEVYAFVHALYVTDMALRLEIVGREVLL